MWVSSHRYCGENLSDLITGDQIELEKRSRELRSWQTVFLLAVVPRKIP